MNQTSAGVKPLKRSFNTSRFRHSIYLESYGVKIRISSNEIAAIDEIGGLLSLFLADRYRLTDVREPDHEFFYAWNKSVRDSLYKNDEKVISRRERGVVLDQLSSQIRLTVAEFAVGRVFVHAGVVGWKGRAIVMPAKSYRGKSTLTAELVRRGALYYSDEYAVIDEAGLVSPFPKMLSIRGEHGDRTQSDHPVEAFGGKAGTENIPVGMILLTSFKPNAKWNPKILSSGKGLMEILRDTIPIRNEPAFTLAVLNRVVKSSLVIRSNRPDASEVASQILDLFESG